MTSRKDIKILVIDDEVEIAEILSETLCFEEFSSTFQTNPIAAMDYLKNNQVSVVLCDANMPEVKGLDVLKFITSLKSPPCFYLCTGDVNMSESEVKRLGGSGLIFKPFSVSDIVDRLSKDLNLA